jgi:hypothetical protein
MLPSALALGAKVFTFVNCNDLCSEHGVWLCHAGLGERLMGGEGEALKIWGFGVFVLGDAIEPELSTVDAQQTS